MADILSLLYAVFICVAVAYHFFSLVVIRAAVVEILKKLEDKNAD